MVGEWLELRTMSLVAGSYDHTVEAFSLCPQSLTSRVCYSSRDSPHDSSHVKSVTTVAICGSIFASGSVDETIKVYKYKFSNQNILTLYNHSTTVTALSFYAPPTLSFPLNLISADAAGNLLFFDVLSNPFNLRHLHSLPVHDNAAINDLAIHPSGKVAITVASNKCFAMVDLISGCRSLCLPLEKEARLAKYNVAGDRFFFAMEDNISVYDAEDYRPLVEFECSDRVLCAAPTTNGLVYTGTEDRKITAWDIKSGKVAHCMEEAHSVRVKGIVVVTDNDNPNYLLASASSDGIIRVWDVRMSARDKPLFQSNTKERITCFAGSSLKYT